LRWAGLKSLKDNSAYQVSVLKSPQWLDKYFFYNYMYTPVLQGQFSLLNALGLGVYVCVHILNVICVEFFDGVCSMFFCD
jgi:hypothetical protein